MTPTSRNAPIVCVLALVALSLRAFTPAGYMPAAAGSGLLFELCPDGLPAGFVQALSDDGHHHHHHGSGSEAETGGNADGCPVGHMLVSAMLMDAPLPLDLLPQAQSFDAVVGRTLPRSVRVSYQSRAPPT